MIVKKNYNKILSIITAFCLLICSINFFEIISFAQLAKPAISAEAGILINANTGEVLYAKNENKRYYPASITKVMTAMLVLDNANLDDTVTFSKSAVSNMEAGAVSIKIAPGDKLSVRDSLYAIMLRSANEVANGLAEHVAGSIPAFAVLMNKKAKEAGAKNTNFVNPSGLNNASHLTTAYDMAMIARKAFENEMFRKIVATPTYEIPATSGRAAGLVSMGHKMIYPGDSRYYKGILGGKTGYTSKAGNTLVTAAERNGVRLIAVVLKSKATHYADTKAMLDYGFSLYGLSDYKEEVKDIKTEVSTNTAGIQGPGASVGIKEIKNNISITEPSAQEKDTNAGKTKDITETKTGNTGNVTPESAKENKGASGIISSGPNESNNTGTNVQKIGPGQSISANNFTNETLGWVKEGNLWYYIKDNKSRAKAEILNIKGYEYWFDDNAYMATGWRKDTKGAWYYLKDSGEMKKSSWLKYKELWYYLGADGKMLADTTTPDGYKLDKNGVWIN